MEFRTDGLVVILEDEQKYLHGLLMRHPRLTMKFTSQIYIPDYSTQDLVNFSSSYAIGQEHVLGDNARIALASQLEQLRSAGEEVSLTTVKALTDEAIARSGRFGRRVFGGKKRYDETGRVILLDKDFR